MSREAQAASVALRAALTGDATLTALVVARVYEALSPQGVVFPHVIFALQAAADVPRQGAGGRIMTRLDYLIKGVSSGADSYASADAIAAAVDGVVEDLDATVTVSATDYRVHAQGRVRPFRFLEAPAGVRYHHAGGIYRLLIDQQ